MNDGREIVEAFVAAISELSRANRLTGIWDNRRFQECKKPFQEIDCAYLYKTEKLSRKNVELRATHRTQIDISFEELLRARTNRPSHGVNAASGPGSAAGDQTQ